MAAEVQQHEYVRSPARIDASKSTVHTLDKAHIYQLLAAAMQPLGIRRGARREPLQLARKVHEKAHLLEPLDTQTQAVQLAVSTAQAQHERDINNKDLLLPAVLSLGLVASESDPIWKDMTPEAAVGRIPPLKVEDLSEKSDLENVYRAQQVADRLRKTPLEVLVIVQCMYVSDATSTCSWHMRVHGAEFCVWDRLCWVDSPRCLIGCVSSHCLFGHVSHRSGLLA